MLNIIIPAKKIEIKKRWPFPAKISETTSIFQEANRRQNKILELVSKINYKEGDITKPALECNIPSYGSQIKVEKICDSYTKWGRSEWPSSDMPHLVVAYSLDKNIRFSCTANFLIKK